MEEIFASVIFWVTGFFGSTFFFFVKIIIAIYVIVLLVDVVLVIYLADVRKTLRKLRHGNTAVPVTRAKLRKQWVSVRGRLASDNEKQWKVAILEADHLLENVLVEQGYHGDNFSERLTQVPQSAFLGLESVREAHKLRNRIIQDENTIVSKETACKTVDDYEDFFASLGM